MKLEILNEVQERFIKPMYEEIRAENELKKKYTVVNELSFETINNILAELEEAKMLNNVLKIKEIEEEINALK